jgi:hypothetical protein
MRVTARDQLIFTLCYEHGFLAVQHLKGFFPSDRERRMRMAEAIRDKLIFRADPPIPSISSIFRLTTKGENLVESFYPYRIPPKRILSPATYIHNMKVIDARLRIAPLWDGVWTPESRLPKATSEIPDAIFTFPSGKEVYVELENSVKSQKRFLRRLETFKNVELTLYIATQPEIERALKKYLSVETPPAGVVLLSNIKWPNTPVWTREKIIHPFSRRFY